ncbi:hemin uptake protein HemP [Methylobacterium sp. sgz302541]|uniref:hemin uptake protein HemP n=1 Tax=unclassified Methylobacterium TaxID=2615210 RepID=UPI003D355662
MPDPDATVRRSNADLPHERVDLPGEPAAAVLSTVLMNGRREVIILHAGERYRLRITANDKLILTK